MITLALAILAAMSVGMLIGWDLRALWEAKQPPQSMTVMLDPYVTEMVVRRAVTEAMAELEPEEPEVLPGDEWRYSKQ